MNYLYATENKKLNRKFLFKFIIFAEESNDGAVLNFDLSVSIASRRRGRSKTTDSCDLGGDVFARFGWKGPWFLGSKGKEGLVGWQPGTKVQQKTCQNHSTSSNMYCRGWSLHWCWWSCWPFSPFCTGSCGWNNPMGKLLETFWKVFSEVNAVDSL